MSDLGDLAIIAGASVALYIAVKGVGVSAFGQNILQVGGTLPETDQNPQPLDLSDWLFKPGYWWSLDYSKINGVKL